MLLGMQLMVLGLFSTASAHYAGLEDTPVSGLVDRSFTLGRGLLASGLVALAGAIVVAAPLLGLVGGRWLRPELEGTGSGVVFLGAQLAFCSLLLGSFPAILERTTRAKAIPLP
jgi:hypothetical protein